MPIIVPIKELHNTDEISNITKINRIDQAIYESEQEAVNGAEAVDADIVFAELEKKYTG